MSDVKHTPGPWRFVKYKAISGGKDTSNYGVMAGHGLTIASTYCSGNPIPSEANEANARLMAAAPDLLYACRHVVQLFRDGAGEVHDLQRADGHDRTILEELTAAIAKAEPRPE